LTGSLPVDLVAGGAIVPFFSGSLPPAFFFFFLLKMNRNLNCSF